MPKIIKLINLKRGHVFRFAGEDKLRLLNENYVNKDDPEIIHFEWHTIFKDGRTSLRGTGCNRLFAEDHNVVDLGDFYDWMKKHHPIRYKREGWEQSRLKTKYWAVKWDNYMGSGSVVEVELTQEEYKQMKENGCGDTPYWGIYEHWIDAEIALDRRCAD